MAVTGGYFNSVNGDRKYNADQMSEYFEGIINEGVCQHIGGGLAVTAGTGLSVVVATGKAFIGQKWLKNDAALTLTISAASESYSRIDAVVIRKNNAVRSCQIAVKVGTPAASPVAPTMTRDATTYEMALAYVTVAAGASSVTVTDKRSDSSVCGWAAVAQATSGEVDQMLNDMKTGFDGVTYDSPAAAMRGGDEENHNDMTSYEDFLYSVDDDFSYDVAFPISGYYPNWNNGTPSANANYSMTKFVSVRGLKSFDFRGVSGNVNSVCFYGQDFTFISGGYATTHIAVPANAYFMKIGIPTADISTFEIYNMVSFLSEIKANADKAELVIDEIKSSLPFYKDSGAYGIAGSPYAPSDIIAAGTKIIGMDIYCSVAGTLKIGFWKLSDNSYYGEQTFPVVVGLNHLSFIYDIEYNSRIIFNNSNLVRYVSSSTGTSIISVSISDNTVTNAGSLANFGLYATMFYFAPSASQTNVLHVGEGQEFATINSALTKAYTLESVSNPITIIVHPGVYEEVLFIQGTHYISIIGLNRDDCIVKDGSADYNKAPIRISGQCYVANMTFIETAETYSSSYGSGTGKSAWKTDVLAGRYIYEWLGTIMSYAVHCDDATNGEDTICRFENCKMYSEVGPAFGGGMQTKQKIQIVNCELITNIDSEVYQYCATTTGKGSISQGTLICHGKNSGSQMGLLVKDCTVEANIGRVLYMYVVGTNNDADIKFINTSFWSPALGGMATYYSFNFADSQINGISHGNNLAFLNKNDLA